MGLNEPLGILRVEIVRQVRRKGPYSHNIVSLILREIAARFGLEASNKAVRDYKLFRHFGISEYRRL